LDKPNIPSPVQPDLLPRVAAGDASAVTQTIDRYGGLVWHLARKTLSRRADQEDAVQEVFVELWKSASRFDPSIASERAFVAMIARRRLIDRGRHERTRIASTVNAGDYSSSIADRPSSMSPGGTVETCEEAALAAEAISQLTPAQQQTLRLSVHEGLSHQEIAERLSLPLGTVKTNLRRGLMRVRELLSGRDRSPSASGAGLGSLGGDA
jgi:RNA polymerase sigma-70 factor (ECF subfamily)